MRKNISQARLVLDQQIVNAVKNNISFAGVLKELGLEFTGTSNSVIRKRIKELNLTINHFKGQGHLKGKSHNYNNKRKESIEKIMVENSGKRLNQGARKTILKSGILGPYECKLCHISGTWNGQPLVLQFDHINGNPHDHRLENLRLLCPNCHSQTDTFTGKNKKKHPKTVIRDCSECGIALKRKTKTGKCIVCRRKERAENKRLRKIQYRPHKHKVLHPTKTELFKLLWKKSTTKIAKDFGVSDNAIAKWSKNYNIPKPPRGYWRIMATLKTTEEKENYKNKTLSKLQGPGGRT